MLRKFIYLDEATLDSYISGLEDGLRDNSTSHTSSSELVGGGGGVKAHIVNAEVKGEQTNSGAETTSKRDTPEARFERLYRLVHEDTESSGWLDVENLDNDFAGINAGNLIEVECEVFIPSTVRALSSIGDLAGTIDQLESIVNIAPTFGGDISGMPGREEIKALKGVSNLIGDNAVLVGDPFSGDVKVAGKLIGNYVHSEIEGPARIVGKVSSKWNKGKWKPLLTIPGSNLISREKRREMERKGPDAGREENWLEGPGLMLDILAVYR